MNRCLISDLLFVLPCQTTSSEYTVYNRAESRPETGTFPSLTSVAQAQMTSIPQMSRNTAYQSLIAAEAHRPHS